MCKYCEIVDYFFAFLYNGLGIIERRVGLMLFGAGVTSLGGFGGEIFAIAAILILMIAYAIFVFLSPLFEFGIMGMVPIFNLRKWTKKWEANWVYWVWLVSSAIVGICILFGFDGLNFFFIVSMIGLIAPPIYMTIAFDENPFAVFMIYYSSTLAWLAGIFVLCYVLGLDKYFVV